MELVLSEEGAAASCQQVRSHGGCHWLQTETCENHISVLLDLDLSQSGILQDLKTHGAVNIFLPKWFSFV